MPKWLEFRRVLFLSLAAAPERVAPPCPYFMRCGGCHYQHAPYETQLALKRAILEDQLRRIGKIVPPEIAVVSGEPWSYRNRVQLHIAHGALGYREAQSHKLCGIEQCPIASPAILLRAMVSGLCLLPPTF